MNETESHLYNEALQETRRRPPSFNVFPLPEDLRAIAKKIEQALTTVIPESEAWVALSATQMQIRFCHAGDYPQIVERNRRNEIWEQNRYAPPEHVKSSRISIKAAKLMYPLSHDEWGNARANLMHAFSASESVSDMLANVGQVVHYGGHEIALQKIQKMCNWKSVLASKMSNHAAHVLWLSRIWMGNLLSAQDNKKAVQYWRAAHATKQTPITYYSLSIGEPLTPKHLTSALGHSNNE